MGKVEEHENGLDCEPCPIWKEWSIHRAQTLNIENKVNGMSVMMDQLLKHTHHLAKLDKLDSLDLLVKAVVGANHDENKIAQMIAKTFGVVILGLVFVIVALLTGAHLELFKLH